MQLCVHAYIYILPGEVRRVSVGDDSNLLAVDGYDVVADRFNKGIEDSKSGVVFEEVRSLFHATTVVNCDDVER